MRAAILKAFLILLVWPALAAAEHPNIAKGAGRTAGFGSVDVDSVNPFNGNLVVRLPIGQAYPVNAGFTYQLSLVYNSQAWEHEAYDDTTLVIPARASNAGLGWALQLGRLNPPRLDHSLMPMGDSNRNTYLAADGTTHVFYPTLHEGETAAAGVEYTRDGSYLRLKTASHQIEFPDGTVHTFSALSNGYLTEMKDPFGNWVRVSYQDCPSAPCQPSQARLWQITDRQNRYHYVHLKDTGQLDQPLVVTKVDLQAFAGTRAVYKLLYNDSTDDASTNGSPVELAGCIQPGLLGDNHVVWLLTRVVLPDGSYYESPKSSYFSYNVPGSTTTPCKTGLLNRLRLPTLGAIEWDYILYHFPSASTTRNVWQKTTGVGVRRLLNASSSSIGQWAYATSLAGGTTAQETRLINSVTDPAPVNTRVTRYFSVCKDNCSHPDGPYEYGLPVGRDVRGDGTGRFISSEIADAAGNVLRETYVRYEHDAATLGATVEDRSRRNQRVASQRTVFRDDAAASYADETFSDFDGLGHYRRRDSTGNFPGSATRVSAVAYNPNTGTYGQAGYVPWPVSSPWILNTSLFNWEFENGRYQYRITCYDTSKGILLRHRILKDSGATEHPNDLLQAFAYDSLGNLATESYYGGDTQPLAYDACNMGLPVNPVYRYSHLYSAGVRSKTTVNVSGSTLNVLDLTIDGGTGLPSQSRDAAGKQTAFTYDTLGRLTVADPANDLLTVYNYCTATSSTACPVNVRAQVIEARRATVNGTDTTATRSRFDDWGRRVELAERMPPFGTYEARTMAYNALGWRTFVSEQGSGNGTSFDYDALGRPVTITPPDGNAHNVTVSYQGARQITRTSKVATSLSAETNAATTETYDRHGRLYEVAEPNGVKTRYEYDAGNRLSKVCQGATGAGTATCGQTRLFTYDHRGFLLSEQHPEKGVSGNGVVSYYNYDARGHVGRKADGPNDLTFTWDKAERLTQVRETGGAQRVLKTFTYAPANFTDAGGTDYRAGKVMSASRFNYVGSPFNATVEVRDTFVYRGAEGRVSETSRQLFFNGAAEERFDTTYAYDGLGLVSALGYPDCVAGDCPASDAPRTVTYNYGYGRLTGVPGYTGTAGGVSQITYHANGLLHQVPHANGVLYTQQNDPNGMLRPSNITAIRGVTGLWTAGSHTYDGTGNVKATGTQTYVYDSLSRVVQGNISGISQSYTYDNYGNLQTLTTGGSTVSTPTSSTTNRLTGGIYDGAGNLKSWNGNAYEYDAFNQMSRFTSGTEDWFYLYGPDDERFWSYRPAGGGSLWTLRDLSGMVLRQYNAHLGWGNYDDYVYRGSALLANYRSNGQQRHFDVDHLGTPRLITDATGNQVGFHTYYPYGREQSLLQEGDRMKFTGHERDLANTSGDADDLDYMHARHYSPVTGRFLSVDPIWGTPAVPQSWNRYAYVMGRAVSYTDPTGMQAMGRQYAPTGMTVDDIAASFNGGTINVTTTAWRGTTSNPYTGLWGVSSLSSGSSFWNSLATGGGLLDVASARDFYQRNFEHYAVEGNTAMALLNFAVDELFVPDSQEELGVELAMAAIPGPLDNAAYGLTKSGIALSKHAVEQMAKRGVSEAMVRAALRKGTRYWDPVTRTVQYVLRGGFISGKTLRVPVDPFSRTVTTVVRGDRVGISRFIPLP